MGFLGNLKNYAKDAAAQKVDEAKAAAVAKTREVVGSTSVGSVALDFVDKVNATDQNAPQGRDVSRDVKLYRDAAANVAIHDFLARGISDTEGVLALEVGDNGLRFKCVVEGERVGCAKHEETERIQQLAGVDDGIPCSVVFRDYDGKAWSACTVL